MVYKLLFLPTMIVKQKNRNKPRPLCLSHCASLRESRLPLFSFFSLGHFLTDASLTRASLTRNYLRGSRFVE